MGGIGGVVLAVGVLEDEDIEWIESMIMRLSILRWFFHFVCWCAVCHICVFYSCISQTCTRKCSLKSSTIVISKKIMEVRVLFGSSEGHTASRGSFLLLQTTETSFGSMGCDPNSNPLI
jgi:hypothetical protein